MRATGPVGLVGPGDSVKFFCVTNCGLEVDVGLRGGLASTDRPRFWEGIGRTWSFEFSNLLIRSLKETCRGRAVEAWLEAVFGLSDADRFWYPPGTLPDELTALYEGKEATL